MDGGSGFQVGVGYQGLDKIPLFLVQVMLMVGGSRLLGVLCKRLRQPLVVAEIITGVLLGPTVLGNIPGWNSLLFPASSLEPLNVASSLALIFYMFVVGLQLDLDHVRQTGLRAVFIATLGLLVAFGIAVPLAYICDSPQYHESRFGNFVMFLGVLMGISALPVMARILSERGSLATQFGMFVMACKIVNDIEVWPLMALSNALTYSDRAAAALNVLWFVPVIIGDVCVLWFVLRPVMRRASQVVADGEIPHWYLFLVTFLLLAFACCTELLGLTSILGALQVGMIMPRNNPHLMNQLASKIQDLTVVVLLPLFFAVSGLKTNLLLITDGVAWFITLLLIVAAFVTMLLGAAVPAMATGMLPRDAAALGVIMTTKGLVGLIALNHGHDMGIITDKFFSMCTIMILGTTIAVVPILSVVQPELLSRAPHPAIGGPRPAALTQASKSAMVCLENSLTGMTLLTAAKLFCSTADRVTGLRFQPVSERPTDFVSLSSRLNDPVSIAMVDHAQLLELDFSLHSMLGSNPAADSATVVAQQSPALIVVPFNQYDEGPLLPALLDQQTQTGIIVAVMSRHIPIGIRTCTLLVTGTSDCSIACMWLKASHVAVFVVGADDSPATQQHVRRLEKRHLATAMTLEAGTNHVTAALQASADSGLLVVAAEPDDVNAYTRSPLVTQVLRQSTVPTILIFRAFRYAPAPGDNGSVRSDESVEPAAEEMASQADPPATVITMPVDVPLAQV